MAIGSQSFSGESCRIFIEAKGDTGSQELSGRLVNSDITGFSRNIGYQQTFGAHLTTYSGYTPASVNMNFIYDQDTSTLPMGGIVGSYSTSVLAIRSTKLADKSRATMYKIKFLFVDSPTFSALTNNDIAAKIIFYNAYGVSMNNTVEADGAVKGQLSFKVNPFDLVGNSNYLELEKDTSTSVSSFDSEESSYDTTMGY
jgi:hypothetical protein